MSDILESTTPSLLEDSIQVPGAPLESISAQKSSSGPSRPPDYEKENRAIVALTEAV